MKASSVARRALSSRPAILVLGSFVLVAACTVGPGAAADATDPPGTPAPAAATPAPTPVVTPPGAPATPSADCLVTRPEPAFHAPAPFPETPPERYESAWYGTADLFTMIALEGEVWTDLPPGPEGLGQKSFWWSVHFTELEPALVVSGERLDASGSFRTSGLGTNASADFGRAMLIGIQIRDAGCWRLTGAYRGATLSYVVWAGPLP